MIRLLLRNVARRSSLVARKTASHEPRVTSHGERGVALILVLGVILVLTFAAVDFAFNAHVAFRMAANNRARLKSYYLARSAMGLARLNVEIEKKLFQQIASYAAQLTGVVSSEPLCKQIPFSTDLLRGLSSGTSLDTGGETEETPNPEDEAAAGEDKGEEKEGDEEGIDVGIQEEGRIKEFLGFDGDFGIECDDEQSKINLNYFRTVSPPPTGGTWNDADMQGYERHKSILISLFLSPTFKDIFGGGRDKARDVATNIADWVDRNDRVNESLGVERGYEDALYVDNKPLYRVKNGKFSSTKELLLVEGVGDDLFAKLKDYVTIYGDNKINPCLADIEVVKALVVHYSETTEGMTPVSAENTDIMDQVAAVISEECMNPVPNVNNIAQSIISAIGGDSGKAQGLAGLMTSDRRYYMFKAYGTVDEVTTTINFVMDASGSSNNWKILYFRFE